MLVIVVLCILIAAVHAYQTRGIRWFRLTIDSDWDVTLTKEVSAAVDMFAVCEVKCAQCPFPPAFHDMAALSPIHLRWE